MHRRSRRIPLALAVAAGCGDDIAVDTETAGPVCEVPDGEWDTEPLDWVDPGEPGEPPKDAPFDDILAHHPYLTAVHASHLPPHPGAGVPAELILFHGQGDERVWPIGAPASDMRWHPVPFTVPTASPDLCSYAPPAGGDCYADIFCSGHVLLPDGRFLVAGGNVNGGPSGGGLVDVFTYDPREADPDVAPFGWAKHDDMAVDRWYPTLTVLADGRVLISSGASRVTGGQNTFELFDPSTDQVSQLTIGGTSPFSSTLPIPLYPFMFLLPNGDVLYAGGEGAPDELADGHVLIPGYNNGGSWTWDERTFTSTINGGSAVMYAPGKVLKSGGLHDDDPGFVNADARAQATAETIDLSSFASGDYASAPNFGVVDPMNFARHFHTLTVLPDGRVLATGGNSRDTGRFVDHWENACEFGGTPIADRTCSDANLDGIPDDLDDAAEGCPAVPSRCMFYDPDGDAGLPTDYYCPLRGDVVCDDLADDDACGSPCPDGDHQCPPGSTCGPDEKCVMPCPENPMQTCGAVVHCSGGGTSCDPANNACMATLQPEIWEEACGWTALDAAQRPRMYHSTALLLPDNRVISMGGGHRQGLEEQTSAELFLPEYGPAGVADAPVITVVGETNMATEVPFLPYGGSVAVVLENAGAGVDPRRFTLVRLGSVTHQNDMDQRFVPLGMIEAQEGSSPLAALAPVTTAGFPASATAPPGYYLLHLQTDAGEVSTGHHVRVGAAMSAVYACPATSTLAAVETSCAGTPVGGVCPTTTTTTLELPVMEVDEEKAEGWRVLVPAGEVADPEAPTAAELDGIDARCVAACEAHWAGDPGVTANCGAPGAFAVPVLVEEGAPGPYALVRGAQARGEGLFSGQDAGCSLSSSCCAAFDEDLCAAAPARTTPARDPLGAGEEYLVALGTTSSVEVVTDVASYAATLSGEVGYSFCRDGSATAACPFYLGHAEAEATTGLAVAMTCDDSTSAVVSLSGISLRLGQPAFGVAQAGATSAAKGFPAGALLVESTVTVGTQTFTARRANPVDVVIGASGGSFSASGLPVTMTVPCNTSTATITANFTLASPATGNPLGRPPVVTNTTASTGACGTARALTATVSDPDADAGAVRWIVDGLLMAPGTTAITPGGSHTVSAVVRDGRGATTTATKVVSCP